MKHRVYLLYLALMISAMIGLWILVVVTAYMTRITHV
jgi:hypothetical protein